MQGISYPKRCVGHLQQVGQVASVTGVKFGVFSFAGEGSHRAYFNKLIFRGRNTLDIIYSSGIITVINIELCAIFVLCVSISSYCWYLYDVCIPDLEYHFIWIVTQVSTNSR